MANHYKCGGRRYGKTISLIESAIKRQHAAGSNAHTYIACSGCKQVETIKRLLEERGADLTKFYIENTNDRSATVGREGPCNGKSGNNRRSRVGLRASTER